MQRSAPTSTNKEKWSQFIGFKWKQSELVQWNFYEKRHHWTESRNNFSFSFSLYPYLSELPLFSRDPSRMCSSYRIFFLVNALHFHCVHPHDCELSSHCSTFNSRTSNLERDRNWAPVDMKGWRWGGTIIVNNILWQKRASSFLITLLSQRLCNWHRVSIINYITLYLRIEGCG